MRRVSLILPLLLVLLLSACGSTTQTAQVVPQPRWSHVLVSVWPLQDNGEAYCTAFSINGARGYWMTAKHCAGDGTVGPLHQPVTLVYEDPDWDVLVLQSASTAPAIPLGKPPTLGDTVLAAGYGYRGPLERLTVRSGVVGLVLVQPRTTDPASLLATFASVPGDSGGPVLNARGELVGLLWGYNPKAEMSWVVPYAAVARVYRLFAGVP